MVRTGKLIRNSLHISLRISHRPVRILTVSCGI